MTMMLQKLYIPIQVTGEDPDYDYLKRLFKNLFDRKGFKKDFKFDWTTT